MSELDTALFLWLNAGPSSPAWLVPLARFASLELPQLLVAATVGAFMVGDARVQHGVIRVVLAMLVAWAIARLAQNLFPMPRPFSLGLGTAWMAHADSASFPSTHASVAFAFGTAMAAATRRWLPALAALALAALMAWSRVCLGLHFPFDILVGALVGGASAWLCALLPLHRLFEPSLKPARPASHS